MSTRKAFNFLRSYFDVYYMLESDEDKKQFIEAVMNKQFHGIDPVNLSKMASFGYNSQKHSLDKSVKGYQDKTKTKLTENQACNLPTQDPWQGGYQDPWQQEKEKEKEKEEEKEYNTSENKFSSLQKKIVKKTLEERKEKFINEILEISKLPKGHKEIQNFLGYWCEKSPQGRKMRFEKEKTFDPYRRLKTWFNNAKDWEKPQKQENRQQPRTAAEELKQKLGLQ